MDSKFDVSVILPVYNSERWLDECLDSICLQKHALAIEVSVFLDSCTDASESVLEKWRPTLEEAGFSLQVSKEENEAPRGVGYAKNKCIHQSSGEYLCFMDSDDMMLPKRIQVQYELAVQHQSDVEQHPALIGCKFRRIPNDSTIRFTKWANNLDEAQLNTQIYTSNGPTVIMPTWFCHKSVFHRVGGFDCGRGIPEDLIFFYKHLRLGGRILRVDEELLVYRYHEAATTFSIQEQTIWDLRVRELEERVLYHWEKFSIWNAGKQGRKLYRSLRKFTQGKVISFCDVDTHKIGSFYTYEGSEEVLKPKIPIIHFKDVKPPLIVCVKLDLTGGAFETNLASLNLTEGKDYHHFN